jgi:hypothetical protein
MLVELKFKDLFQGEIFALFVKLFFYLKAQFIPMARSD